MAMVKCPECGNEISDKAAACVHCGCPIEKTTILCQECGKEISKNAVVCMHCGCPIGDKPPTNYELDVSSTGLNILSFLLPVVGLILYIVYNNKFPIKAKAIGKWAIIGFVLGLVCSAVMYVTSFALLLW